MKKRTKFGLGAVTLLLGMITLSGCTASFCSNVDKARMLYAFDSGVTSYTDTGVDKVSVTVNGSDIELSNVYIDTISYDNSPKLKSIMQTTSNNGLVTPTEATLGYYSTFDKIVLGLAFETAINDEAIALSDIANIQYNVDEGVCFTYITHMYGYVKYYCDTGSNVFGTEISKENKNVSLWNSYELISKKAEEGIDLNLIPSTDFAKQYKTTMNSAIASYRSCLTTKGGEFGLYGSGDKTSIQIDKKTWKYAWNKGFLEGLLIYPIGAFVDVLANAFGAETTSNGVPQILAILIVTVVIRGIMVLVTFKSTKTNAKMTELQPEIAKIQAKYPNANSNTYEKQHLAEETQKLYKKHGVNPFSSLLVAIVQFPVFICVWGALQGSAVLSSGKFLGMDLSLPIKDILFNKAAWNLAGGNFGAMTALLLFILMAVAQTVSMLLPQWQQKAKAKKVAKLGKNPAQTENTNKMKTFTYVMLVFIVIMGFTLVSAMGIYWLVGALVSIAQNLIMQATQKKGAKK